MYYHYFGLEEAPFSISVDPRFLYMSRRHRDALAHLLYGVSAGGGFVLLTGEVGTGKTTINRCLLEQLPEGTEMAIVLNPTLNPVELLATICDELNIEYEPGNVSLKALTDRLQKHLLSNHANGLHTVLLIDEAQHLGVDSLEQIRLLTNLETNTRKLLQIILVGQPELSEVVGRPELRQLSQRITARFSLEPLNLKETSAYIQHRLKVAGVSPGRALFDSRAIQYIHKVSGGIPRLINVICDRALLGTYGRNQSQVELSVLKLASREVLGEQKDQKTRLRGAVLAAVAIVILAGAYVLLNSEPVPPPTARPAVIKVEESRPEPSLPAMLEPVVRESTDTPTTETYPYTRGYGSIEVAQGRLLDAVGINSAAGSACQRAAGAGLRCESQRLNSWQEFVEINRPAVLELLGEDRFVRYLPVVGREGERLKVLSNNEDMMVDMSALGSAWTGNLHYLWNPPPDFSRALGLGDRSKMVYWLAEEFARRDGGSRRLADLEFTESLRQRVILFQQMHGLTADGYVGLNTLRKLTEGIPGSITLDSPSLQSSSEVVGR